MKIGDYIRTEYGISKIIGIFPEKAMVLVETDNGLGNCKFSRNGKLREGIAILEEDYRYFIDNDVKENPIDLIEVGDYVNGREVRDVYKMLGETHYCFKNEYGRHYDKNYKIKSIVTKEQFEAIKYEIK